MKKIIIICIITNVFSIFYISFAMEEQPKRKFSEISEKPEKEKENKADACPIPRKRRRIEAKPTQVKTLKELSKQKFIEVAPHLENLPELLESIPAQELIEEIKAESQKKLSYEETRLHNARSKQEVENFLTLGVDPNAQDRDGKTALNALIDKGQLDEAFHLLTLKQKDLDVSTPDQYGITPLQRAIQHKDLELADFIVEILEEQNKIGSIYDFTPITAVNKAYWSALTLAIRYMPEFLITLQRLGFNFNTILPGHHKNTPLMIAARWNAKAIPLLIAAGSPINAKNNFGNTALMTAAAYNTEALKLLLDTGADITAVNNHGQTALFLALSNPSAIELLIKAGAKLDVPDKYGNRPLYQAVNQNLSGGVKKLLEFGADPNVKSHVLNMRNRQVEFRTPLEAAIENNQPETVKILLDAGANPNTKKANGATALILSIQYQPSAVQLLLEKGADPNAKREHNITPLMYAAKIISSTNATKALLDAGANPNAKTDRGHTALTYAINANNVAAVKLLLDAGTQVIRQDVTEAKDKSEIMELLRAHARKLSTPQ